MQTLLPPDVVVLEARKRHVRKSSRRTGTSSLKTHKSTAKCKITPSKLKKELDRVFSLYIRAKYPKKCYTCGKVTDRLQCGHFIPRIYLATRWLESNCRPQCAGCNIWGRGQLLDFEENLIRELGKERVEDMKELRKRVWKLDVEWYQEQIALFTKKLECLER